MESSLDSSAEKKQQQRAENMEESNPSETQPQKKSRIVAYPQMDWKLQEFDPIEAMKKLESIKDEQEIPMQKQEFIEVVQFEEKGSGVNKYVAYKIKGKDKDGDFEIFRRYKQFDLLHEKLILRWPGLYLPAIPNKTIIGNTQKQVSSNRMRFLNSFLSKIMGISAVYNGEEVQAFLKSTPEEVQKTLQKFKKQTDQEILNKYKQSFKQFKQTVFEQVDIDNFFSSPNDLRDGKTDLVQFKNNLKRLAELRDNYKLKQKNFFQTLMPEFQTTCFQWWENKSLEGMEPNKRIFNDDGLKNSLEQHKFAIFESNPFWLLFDIVKFQLRQIDGIVSTVQNAKAVLNKKKYLQRTIEINKAQLESLSEKQITLKILLMGGSQEDKRKKLTDQSQSCEKQLAIINELYTIVAALGIRSVKNFYQEKLRFYKQMLGKVSKEEIANTNAQIKFHLAYEGLIQ